MDKRPSVLLVDDDDDLRIVMADLMVEFGADPVVGAASLDDVVRQAESALACSLAILDINLGDGRPTGVDVHDWLKQRGFAGRIVYFTGHAANDPYVVAATRFGASRVLSKPVAIDDLKRLLDTAIP